MERNDLSDRHVAVARIPALGPGRQRIYRHPERLRPDHVRACPEFITDAVEKQLKDGFEIGPQTPLAGEVAALVCELTGMERATFCNTGSEAVMAALRVARTVTARNKMVLFAGAYHGTFDEVLVKGIAQRSVRHTRCRSLPGIPRREGGKRHRPGLRNARSRSTISGSHASELAAVLVEPVQSRHPAFAADRIPARNPQDHRACRHGAHLRRGGHGFPGPSRAACRPCSASGPTWPPTARSWAAGMPIGILAGNARVHGRA